MWPYETLQLAKKVQKEISDSDELNITCVCASSVPTGTSILFLFFVIISTMIGPRFTEGAKSNLIF